MDLQTSKIELIKIILEIENLELVNNISTILKKKENDFWSLLTSEEKEEIKFGILQLEKGEKIPFNDFIRKVS